MWPYLSLGECIATGGIRKTPFLLMLTLAFPDVAGYIYIQHGHGSCVPSWGRLLQFSVLHNICLEWLKRLTDDPEVPGSTPTRQQGLFFNLGVYSALHALKCE